MRWTSTPRGLPDCHPCRCSRAATSTPARTRRWGCLELSDGSRRPLVATPRVGSTVAYLRTEPTARPVFGNFGAEMWRRGRALPVWATLGAYGRDGYRAMVERHLRLARRVARQVDEAPDLERLAEVRLNVVCFRFHPPGVAEEALDSLNRRLGESILEDGRVVFGTTEYQGKVAFRPALVR